ncbi:MAG: ECF transporter S component [Clostridia bacterium]|nr:ECF transporter S component [Clostridia bacterium]
MKKSMQIKKMTVSALFLAIALLLPLLFLQTKALGVALSPMHLPVFLCGFICGWPWGLVVGLIAPLLRNLIFGMPEITSAIGMACELAAYGAVSGLLYKLLPKKIGYTYLTLVAAMVLGRGAAVIAKLVIYGLQGNTFSFAAYFSGSVVTSVPGIILQLVLIPIIIAALKKAGFILNK